MTMSIVSCGMVIDPANGRWYLELDNIYNKDHSGRYIENGQVISKILLMSLYSLQFEGSGHNLCNFDRRCQPCA